MEAARIAEEVGPRAVEYRRFNDLLTRRGLALFEVPSDGNCLYCAVQHQLSLRDRLDSALAPEESVTISWLRNCTARFMQEHADDFLPFMSNPETGEPLTPGETSFSKTLSSWPTILKTLKNYSYFDTKNHYLDFM